MAEETLYFSDIRIFGKYIVKGKNEIKNRFDSGISYKVNYENVRITGIETQIKGKTVQVFPSFPAIINYSYKPDSIIITFADNMKRMCKYRNIEKCEIKLNEKKLEGRAFFYSGGKRIADEEGVFEILLKFRDNEFNDVSGELYFDSKSKPLPLKGVDRRGVECGSPGPDRFFYYCGIRYFYDKNNILIKKEYINESGGILCSKGPD